MSKPIPPADATYWCLTTTVVRCHAKVSLPRGARQWTWEGHHRWYDADAWPWQDKTTKSTKTPPEPLE